MFIMNVMKCIIILSIFFVSISFAAKPYPFKTCIVTDSKLGSMGRVITKVYDNQEVKFCCNPCVAKFEKNKAKYLSKLETK